jgi:hypothetical protein
MNVITIEEEAFYKLLKEAIARIRTEYDIKEDKWIPTEQAMLKLGITSKTTLQKLRDEGKIRFTQPQKKIILYDSDSIKDYLEKHSKNTF